MYNPAVFTLSLCTQQCLSFLFVIIGAFFATSALPLELCEELSEPMLAGCSVCSAISGCAYFNLVFILAFVNVHPPSSVFSNQSAFLRKR